MNCINKFITKCLSKLETVSSISSQLHVGDDIWYIKGNNEFIFNVTKISTDNKEIVAKANISPSDIGYENFHKYFANPSIFKTVSVEEEICITGLHGEGNDEYYYTNFKITVVIPTNTKIYFMKLSADRNALFLFL